MSGTATSGGLRVGELAEAVGVRTDTVRYCPCEPAEQLLRRRLADLDAEMARLAALRPEMVAMIDGLPAADCPPPAPGVRCPPTGEEVNPDD